MKRYIRSSRERGMNLSNIISWNGYFYGIKRLKSGERYFKSKSVRFDDTFGGTEEISADEYHEIAEKYYDVFGH